MTSTAPCSAGDTAAASHYAVLGLPDNIDESSRLTYSEIRAAYRREILLVHPDKQQQQQQQQPNDTLSSEHVPLNRRSYWAVQRAWECLQSPTRRREYDQQLRVERHRDQAKEHVVAAVLTREDCEIMDLEEEEENQNGHNTFLDGAPERILVYECRCGSLLEVASVLDGDDSPTKFELINDGNGDLLDCPTCSLVYNTSRIGNRDQ